MNLSKKYKIILFVTLLVVVVAIGSVLFLSSASIPPRDETPLITIQTEGGMNPPGSVQEKRELYDNGQLHSNKRNLPAVVSPSDMKKVRAIISDFDPADYPKHKRGDCGMSPTDGADDYYTFVQRYPNQRFEQCQYVGEGENLLRTLASILEAHN